MDKGTIGNVESDEGIAILVRPVYTLNCSLAIIHVVLLSNRTLHSRHATVIALKRFDIEM